MCRPCGEVVPLATALAVRPQPEALALPMVLVGPRAGALYRPTDLSWAEQEPRAGVWRVTVTPSRVAAAPLGLSALFWDALFLCWVPMLVEHPPVLFLLLPILHLLLALSVTHRAFCALVNRTTIRFEDGSFAFERGPIRQDGDVREPVVNIVGFEAVLAVVRAHGNASRVRWGLHLLTRDGRAVPLQFDFADALHAKYAADRLGQMLADAQRGNAPYRG
ncbi:MAG TPA: hypothetical protein VN894_05390 [Polyangiaceae bacterium]|nr:hypothetical protein [Polyangiaceae bacterium]